MSERKRQKKKKEESETKEEETPTKEQYAVAKYLRDYLPAKKTTLLGHKVDYFIASKAVDALLDSPWASGAKKTPILFTDRESVEVYLDVLLQRKLFHRAKKIVLKDLKKGKKKDEDTADERKSGKEDTKKSAKEDAKKSTKEDEKEGDGEKKKKRKVKLDMHLEQLFIDGSDAYVWIYDPIPMKAWLIGALIVFGSIALCMFPLWPATIRLGVYYLSVAAAGFLVVLLVLAVVRLILFGIIWGSSMGKHHLWLLPNLMEDVGFFESFWPLYSYEYRPDKDEGKDDKEGEEKDSDEKKDEKDQSPKKESKDAEKDEEGESDSKNSANDSNSEGEQTDNGFEVLDKDDLSATEKDES